MGKRGWRDVESKGREEQEQEAKEDTRFRLEAEINIVSRGDLPHRPIVIARSWVKNIRTYSSSECVEILTGKAAVERLALRPDRFRKPSDNFRRIEVDVELSTRSFTCLGDSRSTEGKRDKDRGENLAKCRTN
ncbi:hypothetical protein KPH14_009190 [Odynerus spinipes]|uniref:Uncharacterized protein n=1 Tax=Odynerus spinipes TaxID=1348599 RepID=A0AAD9RP41_9HYME|nr:hypothetical protein KPH14_009190 [Odynerus spinipes]